MDTFREWGVLISRVGSDTEELHVLVGFDTPDSAASIRDSIDDDERHDWMTRGVIGVVHHVDNRPSPGLSGPGSPMRLVRETANKPLRIGWLIWCGLWAFVWLVGGVGNVLNDYAGSTLDSYTATAAGIDLVIPIGLCVASIAAMRAPVGQRWRKV